MSGAQLDVEFAHEAIREFITTLQQHRVTEAAKQYVADSQTLHLPPHLVSAIDQLAGQLISFSEVEDAAHQIKRQFRGIRTHKQISRPLDTGLVEILLNPDVVDAGRGITTLNLPHTLCPNIVTMAEAVVEFNTKFQAHANITTPSFSPGQLADIVQSNLATFEMLLSSDTMEYARGLQTRERPTQTPQDTSRSLDTNDQRQRSDMHLSAKRQRLEIASPEPAEPLQELDRGTPESAEPLQELWGGIPSSPPLIAHQRYFAPMFASPLRARSEDPPRSPDPPKTPDPPPAATSRARYRRKAQGGEKRYNDARYFDQQGIDTTTAQRGPFPSRPQYAIETVTDDEDMEWQPEQELGGRVSGLREAWRYAEHGAEDTEDVRSDEREISRLRDEDEDEDEEHGDDLEGAAKLSKMQRAEKRPSANMRGFNTLTVYSTGLVCWHYAKSISGGEVVPAENNSSCTCRKFQYDDIIRTGIELCAKCITAFSQDGGHARWGRGAQGIVKEILESRIDCAECGRDSYASFDKTLCIFCYWRPKQLLLIQLSVLVSRTEKIHYYLFVAVRNKWEDVFPTKKMSSLYHGFEDRCWFGDKQMRPTYIQLSLSLQSGSFGSGYAGTTCKNILLGKLAADGGAGEDDDTLRSFIRSTETYTTSHTHNSDYYNRNIIKLGGRQAAGDRKQTVNLCINPAHMALEDWTLQGERKECQEKRRKCTHMPRCMT